jgi:ribonuclease-3
MNLETLEKKIQYTFKNRNILRIALTHKSTKSLSNNEQYEFLGDRVLGLVIAENLINNHSNLSEGNLDKIFSTFVNKDKCAEIAQNIKLGDFLILGKTEIASDGKNKISILADACEALIASIYIDGGYEAVKTFINFNWQNTFDAIDLNFKDPKSALQEWCLKKYKKLPVYELINQEGEAHAPLFTVKIEFNTYKKTEASAGNIKDAEKKAAIHFIEINNIKI